MKILLLFLALSLYLDLYSIKYEYLHYVGSEPSFRTFEIIEHDNYFILRSIFEDIYIESKVDKDLNLQEQFKNNSYILKDLKIEIIDKNIVINNIVLGDFDKNKIKPLGNIEFLGKWVNQTEKKMKFFIITEKYDNEGNPVVGEINRLEFQLRKIKKETLKISGKNVETVKVLYTLVNPLYSMFWKNYYWYRLSDGLLVKYEPIVIPPNREGRRGEIKLAD